METIREARLQREAADRYPFIPVRMWTQAARMADLVREHLEHVGRRVRARRRALVDRDFRFRGGLRHPPGAYTRLTDPELQQWPVAIPAQQESRPDRPPDPIGSVRGPPRWRGQDVSVAAAGVEDHTAPRDQRECAR